MKTLRVLLVLSACLVSCYGNLELAKPMQNDDSHIQLKRKQTVKAEASASGSPLEANTILQH